MGVVENLGAALYRAGQYQEAVQRLQEAIRLHEKGGTAWMQCFLAMARHRLGRATEATRILEKVFATEDRYRGPVCAASLLGALPSGPLAAVAVLAVPLRHWPDPQSGSLDWQERLLRQVLLQEAKTVLQAPPAQP